MQLTAGRRLGPYEVVAPLGSGGMGQVWRARDRRLERSVAIKVLPPEFSADAQLRLRFEREARTISQLNHPNICTLYDVGHEDGASYLVMELIEGESLADRIARGPLPLADVIRYGAEVAEALEKAHQNGIVHRDLKPGNIMLTRTGAKLLDFGLAKTAITVGGPASVVETAQKPLTAEGSIVGTFYYMSPEQLEGERVDHRTDIFSLGAVLYEMATGRRPFDGKTRTSVIAAIVAAEPAPMTRAQPATPPALERLIRTCLAKDPDQRLQSAHDVAVQLRWIGDSPAVTESSPRSSVIPWTVAAVLAIALAGTVATRLRTPAAPPPVVRFTLPSPPQTVFSGIPAVSPDGRSIIFDTASLGSPSMLWIRSLDSVDARPLKGTEHANHVFWAPDGKRIAFVARNKLWRLDLADGSVHALYEPVEGIPGGGTWNEQDVILFAAKAEGPLLRIAASGGEAVRVTDGTSPAMWPWFLPDGDHFVFAAEIGKRSGIYAGSLSSPQRKLLVPVDQVTPSRPAYASGYLFYNRNSALYAQKFDVEKLEIEGDPQKIVDNMEYYAPGRAAYSVSSGGTLVYHEASAPIVAQLTFVDRNGTDRALAGPVSVYTDFRLSPDQRRIAYARFDANPSAWILDIARGAATRIAFEPWSGVPVWLPDSRDVVYAATVDTPPNLFLRRADGSVRRLTKSPNQFYPTATTPDGKLVIADFVDPVSDYDVVAVGIDPPHSVVPLANTKFKERGGVVSPDGKWLAYSSDENGRMQVYVRPMSPGGTRVQISTEAGRAARWSADGRRLYYVDYFQNRVMEVSLSIAGGEMQPSSATALFTQTNIDYDVTADGRFLVAREKLNPDAAPLNIVMNWTSSLR